MDWFLLRCHWSSRTSRRKIPLTQTDVLLAIAKIYHEISLEPHQGKMCLWVICGQRRPRSDCADAWSDQGFLASIGLDKGGYPINIFLISPRKCMLWVLIRSASALNHDKNLQIYFFCVKRQAKNDFLKDVEITVV